MRRDGEKRTFLLGHGGQETVVLWTGLRHVDGTRSGLPLQSAHSNLAHEHRNEATGGRGPSSHKRVNN
jgi:hypothetical protein